MLRLKLLMLHWVLSESPNDDPSSFFFCIQSRLSIPAQLSVIKKEKENYPQIFIVLIFFTNFIYSAYLKKLKL
jgi:hypothetical protein